MARCRASYLFGIETRERVGPRHDSAQLAVLGNSNQYQETQGWLYGAITPTSALNLELEIHYGDEIDFLNDRLGTKP